MSGEIAKLFVTLGLSDSDFQKSMKKVQTTLTQTGKMMTGIGASITAALGLATNAAIKEQTNINRLSNALKNVGINYDKLSEQIESNLAARQAETNYGDTEQRDALVELIGITGTYTGALEQLQLATDLAAAKDMDLTAAATLVGRAAIGNTDLLSRYGIVVEKGATTTEVLADMQERFAGSAKAAINPITQLKNDLGDLVEDIGGKLVPVLQNIVDSIRPVIENIRKWINDNPELTGTIVKVVGAIGILFSTLGPLLIMLPMLAAGFQLLLGPVGWVILAITALAAGATLLVMNWAKVSEFFKDAWENIKLFFLRGVYNILDSLSKFTSFIPGLSNSIDKAKEKIGNMIDAEEIKKDAREAVNAVEEWATEQRAIIKGMTADKKDELDQQRKDAENAYNDEITALRKKYGVIEDEDEETAETLMDTARRIRKKREEQIDKEMDALREEHALAIDLINKECNAKLKSVDDETSAAIDALNDQIDAIEKTQKQDDKLREEAAAAEKRAELEAAVASAKTDNDRAAAQAVLDKWLTEQNEKAVDEQRSATIESLRGQIQALRDAAADKKKTIENDRDAAIAADNAVLKNELDNLQIEKDGLDKDLAEKLTRLETERIAAETAALETRDTRLATIAEEESALEISCRNKLALIEQHVRDVNDEYANMVSEHVITVREILEYDSGDSGGTTSIFRDTTPPTDPIAGIKAYANGGPILEPTLLYGLKSHKPYALAGESGPEYVSSMDDLKHFGGSGFSGGYNAANIFLEIDGRTLAKIIGQPLVDEIRLRTGISI